jgi:hypothetical protein
MPFSQQQTHEQLMQERQIRVACLQLATQGRETWDPRNVIDAAAAFAEFALEGRTREESTTGESDAEEKLESLPETNPDAG